MSMSLAPTVGDIRNYLQSQAPLVLAEGWDNVGLLVGDPGRRCGRIMTCLTVTPETVAEGIARGVDLIVTHHPLPFRPLKEITTTSGVGRLLWDLIGARISVFSAHTAFDAAEEGINASLARMIGLASPRALLPIGIEGSPLGAGRIGDADGCSFAELIARCKAGLRLSTIRGVGDGGSAPRRVAIACGSGGSLLEAAIHGGGDVFVTGELTFHHCLQARERGMRVLLLGHFASERFAMETLAARIGGEFSEISVWASEQEHDPLWIG